MTKQRNTIPIIKLLGYLILCTASTIFLILGEDIRFSLPPFIILQVCLILEVYRLTKAKPEVSSTISSENFDISFNESMNLTKFNAAMDLSEIGFLLKYVEKDTFHLSAYSMSLIGVDTDRISYDELIEKIHPSDRVKFECSMKHSERHALLNIFKSNKCEIRIMTNNEDFKWYSAHFKPFPADKSEHIIACSIIDITDNIEKDSLIQKMAFYDEVTQIYNRAKFMMLGEEVFECSEILCFDYWLIVFDIDQFHLINDTCGYENGNLLLKRIAMTILKGLDDSGFCGRVGGDNFAIILKNVDEENYAENVIRKIKNDISKLNVGVFSNQRIKASAGYIKINGNGNDFSEVLERAEFALRVSKDTNTRITQYHNDIHNKIIANNKLEQDIEQAIANKEFTLYYQPKVSLADESLVGVEALIRWVKEDGTIVPPSEFIPIAENSYLITKISEYVINEACMQNKRWQDMGFKKMNVSVNLSPVDFYQTDICNTVRSAINLSKLDAKWLEIELTETVALRDIENAISQMTELNGIGIKISMDDFGTGYSSLSYIQVLPIALLKLDRSFVMYLEEDEVSQQIVSAVINICKSKNISIIAEGIETIGQAEILRKAGCDHAQGYLFGKPMTVSCFENYLRSVV